MLLLALAMTAAAALPANAGAHPNLFTPNDVPVISRDAFAKLEARCPQTARYLAGKVGIYRGQPLTPRKLTELPPATAFMAVYRHIGRCEAPMTMVEYSTRGRRR